MKNIKEKASYFAEQFESLKKEDKTIFVLKDDANPKLKDAVQRAHGDKLPDDFVYYTFLSLLEAITDCNAETADEKSWLMTMYYLDNISHEIIDGQVSIYTKDLTEWLNSDISNVYYLTEALQEQSPDDGFKLLAIAQYNAIEDIFEEVKELLTRK